jgi:hypothetical protein
LTINGEEITQQIFSPGNVGFFAFDADAVAPGEDARGQFFFEAFEVAVAFSEDSDGFVLALQADGGCGERGLGFDNRFLRGISLCPDVHCE